MGLAEYNHILGQRNKTYPIIVIDLNGEGPSFL